MTVLPLVILGITAVGLITLIVLSLQHRQLPELFVKTALSLLFLVLAAWGATQPVITAAGLNVLAFCVLIGLALGLLGDIWLNLKSTHPEYRMTYMIAGFGCFGLGHIVFFIGLYRTFATSPVLHLLLPLVAAAGIALLMALVEKPLKMDFGSLRIAVLAYAFIISTTTVLSIVLCFEASTSQPAFFTVFAVGMVLFLFSDMVLLLPYFSERNIPEIITTPLNYGTYYCGQFAIAASLLFIIG